MKKKLKRSLAIMISVGLLLAVAGCGGKEEEPGNRPSNEPNPYDLLSIGNLHIGMWVTPPEGFGAKR